MLTYLVIYTPKSYHKCFNISDDTYFQNIVLLVFIVEGETGSKSTVDNVSLSNITMYHYNLNNMNFINVNYKFDRLINLSTITVASPHLHHTTIFYPSGQ